jgi:hypothetical protein
MNTRHTLVVKRIAKNWIAHRRTTAMAPLAAGQLVGLGLGRDSAEASSRGERV